MILVVAKWFFPFFCNAFIESLSNVEGVTCTIPNEQQNVYEFDVTLKHRTYHVCIRLIREKSKAWYHINVYCETDVVFIFAKNFFPNMKDIYLRGFTRNVGECVRMAVSAMMNYEWRMADKKRHEKRMLVIRKMKLRIDQMSRFQYGPWMFRRQYGPWPRDM